MAFTNPAWVDPIEATFDEGKPIRSEQGLLLAGNPIAIAQGAAGAPKVRGKALDIVVGTGTGTTQYIDLDDAAKIVVSAQADAGGGTDEDSATVSYRTSSDNGSSWNTSVTIAYAYKPSTAAGGRRNTASGAVIVDMTGLNAIEVAGEASSVFIVEGV